MSIHQYLLIFLLVLPLLLPAQPPKQSKDPYQEKYEWRLSQEVLYGVYIPKDVNEVFLELNKKMDEPSKNKFKNLNEEAAAKKIFFSLGRWMTHNWGLYEGSRLSKYMQDMGVHHPDDMVRFFIIAYHRNLNRKPLEIKELLQQIQEKEKLEKQKRIESGTIIYGEKRKLKQPPAERNNPR